MTEYKQLQQSEGVTVTTPTPFGFDGTATAKSANYTITDTDGILVVLMTTSSTDRTVTLPTAADNASRKITVKKVDTGTGVCNVASESAGEFIDYSGISNYVLAGENASITLICNGTNWETINIEPTLATVAKSADYTVTEHDGVGTILMTTSSTDRTVTLPLAANSRNRILIIKKIDTGTGNLILDGNGSETIDGATTVTLGGDNAGLIIQCNGTAWESIGFTAGTVKQSGLQWYWANAIGTQTETAGAANGALRFSKSGDNISLYIGAKTDDPTTTYSFMWVAIPAIFTPASNARSTTCKIHSGAGVETGELIFSDTGYIALVRYSGTFASSGGGNSTGLPSNTSVAYSISGS